LHCHRSLGGFFYCQIRGEHSRQSRLTHDTRIALFLLGELIAAIRANDPETFKEWLCGGVQVLGAPVI